MDQPLPQGTVSRFPRRKAYIVAGTGLAVILCQTVPLLPGPEGISGLAKFLLVLVVLSALPLVVCVLAFPVLLVIALVCRNRQSLERLVFCLALGTTLFMAIQVGWVIGRARFAAAAENAKPVIEALEVHRTKRGSYPESVDLPSTGLMAFPKYTYTPASKEHIDPFEGYQLTISCSVGMSFDQFVYWPSRNYPSHMYGGVVERIGDWAYIHE
jgi:hypothetical protein